MGGFMRQEQGYDVYWNELQPSDHLVQFYSDSSVLLDTLEGFVGGALRSDESAVVIATDEHLRGLELRLAESGIDLASARLSDRFVGVDADQALAVFMVGGWPDEARFDALVSGLVTRAGRGGRKVRAFGEMVALLWIRGNRDATVLLEQLWTRLCSRDQLSLLCAYGTDLFENESDSAAIHALHGRRAA